jgi:5-methylcytosine-specific restriction protein B
MTINQLGKALSDLYHNAPKGEAVAMIHLFGIKYAKELNEGRFNKKEVARTANIPESFGTEISKGIKLSKYVIVKNII